MATVLSLKASHILRYRILVADILREHELALHALSIETRRNIRLIEDDWVSWDSRRYHMVNDRVITYETKDI